MNGVSWDVLIELLGLALASGMVLARLSALEKKVETLEKKVEALVGFDARLRETQCRTEYCASELTSVKQHVHELLSGARGRAL